MRKYWTWEKMGRIATKIPMGVSDAKTFVVDEQTGTNIRCWIMDARCYQRARAFFGQENLKRGEQGRNHQWKDKGSQPGLELNRQVNF